MGRMGHSVAASWSTVHWAASLFGVCLSASSPRQSTNRWQTSSLKLHCQGRHSKSKRLLGGGSNSLYLISGAALVAYSVPSLLSSINAVVVESLVDFFYPLLFPHLSWNYKCGFYSVCELQCFWRCFANHNHYNRPVHTDLGLKHWKNTNHLVRFWLFNQPKYREIDSHPVRQNFQTSCNF